MNDPSRRTRYQLLSSAKLQVATTKISFDQINSIVNRFIANLAHTPSISDFAASSA